MLAVFSYFERPCDVNLCFAIISEAPIVCQALLGASIISSEKSVEPKV